MDIVQFLVSKNINPSDYIRYLKYKIRNYDLNPSRIHFSYDTNYKVYYCHNGNKIYFGKNRYNDYYIYKKLENQGIIPKGTSEMKRLIYINKLSLLNSDWKINPLSKTNLILNVLW